MGLKELLAENRLEQRATSAQEIQDLLKVASRGLQDASVKQLSLDGRFNFAYDAALVLATIPLRCAGYRTRGEGHHVMVFDLLSEIMGKSLETTARYLQKCRKIRNMSTYSRSGIVSQAEVDDLISHAEQFYTEVSRWIKDHYPKCS